LIDREILNWTREEFIRSNEQLAAQWNREIGELRNRHHAETLRSFTQFQDALYREIYRELFGWDEVHALEHSARSANPL
jgi:hypothetical protein